MKNVARQRVSGFKVFQTILLGNLKTQTPQASIQARRSC